MWLYAEEPQVTLKKIHSAKTVIFNVANDFEVDPLILSSIIYTERTLNFNWDDEIFDEYLADIGYNSSIGFCQVKIKTAFYIESVYLKTQKLQNLYNKYFSLSQNKIQIIEKLKIDSINIVYAAAYIRLIQDLWKAFGFPIQNKPVILGTLYSIGLYNPNGTLRQPHFAPIANEFGLVVLNSFKNIYSKQIL